MLILWLKVKLCLKSEVTFPGNILILVLYFQQTLFRYSVLGHVIQTTVLFSLDWLHSRHRAQHTY